VALEQFGRIEIIRGPGGVEYGDKAVRGVINIFTKAPSILGGKDSGSVSVGATHGAYGAHGGHVTARGPHGPTAISLSVSHSESDGYRVNAGLRKTDIRTRLTVRASRWASIDGAISYHEDLAGLPGALPSASQSSI
jgi:iron complex outermembrane receptor protein